MKRTDYVFGALFAAAGALCWSLGGALVRLTHGIDPWQIIFYRSITVLLCMGLWLGVQYGRRLPAVMAHAGVNGVISGIAIGIAGLTFIFSLFYTTVAQAIFMTGFAPFFSAVIAWLLLREAIPGITWLAMTIAIAGLAVMLIGGGADGSVPGTVLAIYSAFCFSCYAVLLRWGKASDMNVALIWNALFLILVSAAVLGIATPLRPGSGLAAFAVGWSNLVWIIIMGAVQLSLGLALFTMGSKSVPAAQLSLLALVEPSFAPVWVFMVSREQPPVWTFIGGGIIMTAVGLQAIFASRSRLS